MTAIILTGKMSSGKSTTILELCQEINPSKIWQLDLDMNRLIQSSIQAIFNNAFVIEKNNKFILVLAGCPTEMDKSFTQIYEICMELNLTITFVISAKRTREIKEGFSTKKEIEKFGFVIYEEKINRINSSNFKESKDWQSRIERLLSIVLQKLN